MAYLSFSRLALLVAVFCVLLCSQGTAAPSVASFATAVKSTLEGISSGFVAYYPALVGAPTMKTQYCTDSISNMAPGLALSTETAYEPYGVLATSAGLVVYKDNYIYGPSVQLVGVSFRIADGSMASSVQRGNSLLMPYTANSIIMVTGTITNGTATNILPMSRFMVIDSYLCTSMTANLTTFSSSLTTLFSALAAAA